MRALIFNSGLGSRLGKLTAKSPKAMVRLGDGETIFGRQLRVLSECGVREFVVTTGPHPEQLMAAAAPYVRRGCTFSFVPNPIYDQTNYIYSMWRARDLLRQGDWLLLHGDLVFDAAYAQGVIDSPLESLGSVNAGLPQPEKDFKARVADGEVREVSVSISGGDCVAFQPFYKLSERAMNTWLDAVEAFVGRGDVKVYAENAANTVFERMHVAAHSYEGHFVEEVDTPEDLARVSAGIRLLDFAQRPVFRGDGTGALVPCGGEPVGEMRDVSDLAGLLAALGMAHPMVVASRRFEDSYVRRALDGAGVPYRLFSGFSPNPTYEEVTAGVRAFQAGGCDSLLSYGGGSAIDVAKCVKVFAAMPTGAEERYAEGLYDYSPYPHVAVPTTAGTGSESTHFAVCYVDGRKVSVSHDCLMPEAAVLDPTLLATLPAAQRGATFMDALSQAIESHWSAGSTDASRAYSAEALRVLNGCAEAWLGGDAGAAWDALRGSDLAGQAINLSKTTAPHAMSYGLTKRAGIPHGHAVALCLPACWEILIERGNTGTLERLGEIAGALGCDGPEAALGRYREVFALTGLAPSVPGTREDVEALAAAVDPDRLGNFPVRLGADDLRAVYSGLMERTAS